MGEFSLPFSELPFFLFFFSYPSNIEIIFDFSDIITKIHPPFQNPGSALANLYHLKFQSANIKLRWPNTVFKCLCLIHHYF